MTKRREAYIVAFLQKYIFKPEREDGRGICANAPQASGSAAFEDQ